MPPPDPPRAEPESERFCRALLELIATRDYDSITLAQLLDQAGLPRAAFARHFTGLEECFESVWEQTDSELTDAVAAAYRGEGEWRDRLRRAFLGGLCYLAADPPRARLYLTQAFGVSEELRLRSYDSVLRLAQIIDRGRSENPDLHQLPDAIAEAVSGSIFYRVGDLVRAGQSARLPDQLHELMYLAVLPYLGVDAAEAELRLT